MKKRASLILLITLLGSIGLAFCGFYVGKADTDLFNESSEVIIARDGNRTILTMSNDYQGEMSEFAIVVPIPYVFSEEQIQVGDPLIFDKIDAYSAPRLVEYFDSDPCYVREYEKRNLNIPVQSAAGLTDNSERARSLGVTIEDKFTVGEYDILILGAEESDGLETWLIENGYKIPKGAREALAPYIKMGMKFFVAKVNLEEFDKSNSNQLRPIMMAFQSDDFMLPIQLGMVNAKGPQDLIVYLLSPEGRVELANYRTAKMPSDVNVPEFVENEFGEVYTAMFENIYEREGKNVALLEYAWDMAWCDPCAADPLSQEELLQAGVFWLDSSFESAPNVYLTRMHVRYTPEKFKNDLVFKVTQNRDNFQGRYIMQRPFKGEITCEVGKDYVQKVRDRQEREARNLANLTGWKYSDIWAKVEPFNPSVEIPNWWQRVFKKP